MEALQSCWDSAARTDRGKVRERNEDSVLDLPGRGIWLVADGMGGHQNGALASRLIVEEIAELSLAGNLDQQVRRVRQALHVVNRRLGHEVTVTADQPDAVMGSTVVALLADEQRAVCLWAGDSRCYLWRNQRLYQLSRDHSLMQQLIHEEHMEPLTAAKHPAANALTRAIGAHERLVLDIIEFSIQPGDTLLLCSDGLYQAVSSGILSHALGLLSPAAAIEYLFTHALSGPARDNISAVVMRR
ncbi:MAG: PP2C family serine/threonine-protein phosphatase [Halopseudomonas sp.]|uniref:PP2C family protein-serine/threonine phosphatase n=1 Tax=Halopseudomonas sp. TaxID=2901191 RepID=UPI003001655F